MIYDSILYVYPCIFMVSTALIDQVITSMHNFPSLRPSPSSSTRLDRKRNHPSPLPPTKPSRANPGLLQSVGVSGFAFLSILSNHPWGSAPFPCNAVALIHSPDKADISSAAKNHGLVRKHFLPSILARISIRSGDHYFLLRFTP